MPNPENPEQHWDILWWFRQPTITHIHIPPIEENPLGGSHDIFPAAKSMSHWAYPSAPPCDSQENDVRSSCLGLPLSLPYEVETLAEMDDRLEYICAKLVECIKAGEWGQGFRTWDTAMNAWGLAHLAVR